MNETDIEIIRAIDLPEYEGNPKDAKMLVTTSEGMKQMSGEAYPQLDTTTAAEGDIPVVGEGGNLVGSGIKAENVAQKDGYYAQMTAGAAENLVGQTPDKEAYLMRPTGGESNEVANGIASVVGAEGNSCVWNQLVKNGNFSNGTTNWTAESGVTFSVTDNIAHFTKSSSANRGIFQPLNTINGHRYYIRAMLYCGTSSTITLSCIGSAFIRPTISANVWTVVKGVVTADSNGTIFYIYENGDNGHEVLATNVQIIDLTLLGIDNLTTTAQVEAWLAQHVGTKLYYAYNAGEILSAKMIGMRTVGRNLLDPETKQATLIPYTWEDNSNVFIVKNVPSGATATYTPDNTGEAVSVDVSGGSLDITNYGSGVLKLSAATAETYVCFKWDGTKDNDVVPHVEHNYAFDTRKVYGKVNGQGEYVQCFPDGMKSAGTAKDTLTASEANDNIISVDLGILNAWTLSSEGFFRNQTLQNVIASSLCICTKYQQGTAIGIYQGTENKAIIVTASGYITNVPAIAFRDSDISQSDISSSGKISKLNGVMLYCKRATPITYTDLIYRDNGVDTPLSEVLINMEVDNWGTEQQLVTPYEDGNPTSIPATLSTIYSMDAVEAIDTLQKTTYTEAEVHDNLAALLACVNTNCSEVLGGTFAVSDTATDKVFNFSFTANPEPSDNSNDNTNE